MRVLHVTPEPPYAPGGSGGSARQHHLLRRLAELGHRVTVATVATAEQAPRALALREAGIQVEVVGRPSSRAVEATRAGLGAPGLIPAVGGRPVLAWQAGVFWVQLRPRVRALLDEGPPDVVCVEHDWAAAWARDLPAAVPSVLTLHNLSWRYYDARARAESGLRRVGLGMEAARWRRHDRTWLPRYDRLVTVSEQDRAGALELVSGARVEVVPNGVDTEGLQPTADAPEPDTLVFTGSMAYPPNAEGIAWFVREVWPTVRDARPEARLLVVGRDPSEAVRSLGDDPGVEVTGAVPDIDPYFARATAAIVPIRSGGGTRLKVLEALAAGRPVVSTRLGAEGIEVRDDEHLLLADEPGEFAAAAVRLLEDGELRSRLATAGRQLVEERYDWRALGDRLEAVLADATGDRD